MKKIFFLSFLFLLVISFIGIWNLVSSGYDKQNKTILIIKKIIPSNVARYIRDTVFFIPELKNRNEFLELQLKKFEQGLDGKLYSSEKHSSDDNYSYSLRNFFLPFPSLDISLGWKSKKNYKRAHYLEVIDQKVLVISGEGDTVYFDKINIYESKLKLKRISNNLISVLNERGSQLSSIRDLYYEDDYIYLSVLETKSNKSYLNIYRAKKNFGKLEFNIFFENKEFVEGNFNLQTGGRITNYNTNEILFSVGFVNNYEAPQNLNSIFGKIISINKNSKEYKIISIGHRNPQGLFFSKDKNLIINTEHGPMGGDEVNLNFLDNEKIVNFGWPIASYGEPYPKQDKKFYKENGFLKKSHSDNGFKEPLKYFTPSIGISEVTYLNNKLYVSSLRAESIYIIELTQSYKIKNQKRLKFKSRIRDLKYDKETDVFLILFENIPAIGALKFN